MDAYLRTSGYIQHVVPMQDLSPNRPWLDLCPWLAQMPRSMVSVEAWREGRLPDGACGTVVTPSAPLFKPTPLGDLAGVPISAWQNFVGHLLAHMVNAQAFSSRRGDALEHQSLQLLGEGGHSKPAVTCNVDQQFTRPCTVSVQ